MLLMLTARKYRNRASKRVILSIGSRVAHGCKRVAAVSLEERSTSSPTKFSNEAARVNCVARRRGDGHLNARLGTAFVRAGPASLGQPVAVLARGGFQPPYDIKGHCVSADGGTPEGVPRLTFP